MYDELTEQDIKKMEEEIEYRKLVVRKEALEAVKEARAQALGKLYVGSPFSCSVNLRGQPTGCPRFFYAAPSNRAPG